MSFGQDLLAGCGLKIGMVAGIVDAGTRIEEAQHPLPVMPTHFYEAVHLGKLHIERPVLKRIDAFEEALEIPAYRLDLLIVLYSVFHPGLHAIVDIAVLIL